MNMQVKTNEAVLLLSGGMDSGVLLAVSRSGYAKIHAVGFDYGSRHNARELTMAKCLADKYEASFTTIALPFVNDLFSSSILLSGGNVPEGSYNDTNMRSTVVPFRNGIMLSVAIGMAENLGIKDVLIAAHAGDHPVYPDCRESFVNAMSKAANEGTYTGVRVIAPFVSISKAKIAEIGRGTGFDFSLTWSCYKGRDLHCGKCATCNERKTALGFDRGLDPTRYEE
jgi:7-cyano-7-deazaguanine synthase